MIHRLRRMVPPARPLSLSLLPFALALLAACTAPPPAPAATDPLSAAAAAQAAGDHADAVALLAPLAVERPDLAQALAEARLAWGLALAESAPGEPAALRAAFDQFSLGLAVAPADPQRATLEAHQRVALGLLALAEAREQLRGQGAAPAAEQIAQAAALAALAEAAAAAQPPIPGADQLIGGALLAAAEAYRAGAEAGAGGAERDVWQAQAQALCLRAQAALPATDCPEPGAAQQSTSSTPSAPALRRPPEPAQPGFAVAQRKSFEGSGASGRYESCIDVQILGHGGPIGGAVVGINNGEHSYQSQTDAGGYTGRCGLGASTWSVVIFWLPPDRTVQGVATTVYLSGAPEQRAAVVFQEQ